jgi:hypothetical protein
VVEIVMLLLLVIALLNMQVPLVEVSAQATPEAVARAPERSPVLPVTPFFPI